MKREILAFILLAASSLAALEEVGCSSKSTTDGDGGSQDGGTGGASQDTSPGDAAADTFDPNDPEGNCVSSGGTVATQLCCESTGDFPNLCSAGACSCAADASKSTKVCACPVSLCWSGTRCGTR